MLSYSVGWISLFGLGLPLLPYNCVRGLAKAVARLSVCTGSSEPSLLAYSVINKSHVRFYVIVILWVVRLYVEIIHELLRVDYLTYRWTNMV